jgi:thioredoxin reductase (NADPH)
VAVFEGDPADGRLLTVHQAGEFTGDVNVLTGHPSLVTGVTRGETIVYELDSDRVREVIGDSPWLADVLLDAFVARRRLLERGDSHPIRVIGSRYAADTTRIRQFLSRNAVPFTWVDPETDADVDQVLQALAIDESETPVVDLPDRLLRNPSNADLAEALGLREPVDEGLYDLAIIGAGPSGLAAAVYAASEGLRVVVLEQLAPGGQAGCSSRIENYLGFPSGVSGAELTDRAVLQAYKFGALISNPSQATGLDLSSRHPAVLLETGERVDARAVLIASGAEYRRLDVPDRDRFDGAGIYYSATTTEVPLCEDRAVIVVGGGNSAGQAAVFLSNHARRVHLVARCDRLEDTMSRYLVRRIQDCPDIEVLTHTEIVGLEGDTQLEQVRVRDMRGGGERTLAVQALFSMIGAVPRADWVPAAIEKDRDGFIRTGPDVTTRRAVYLLETSVPGVFAAGDVRSGSSKRVAASVGEGAMAVQFVHQFLDR